MLLEFLFGLLFLLFAFGVAFLLIATVMAALVILDDWSNGTPLSKAIWKILNETTKMLHNL